MKKPVRHRKLKIALLVLTGLFLAFLCIPVPKFDKPYSTVLTASDGQLLGAKIADDGQWRFPATNNYSPKYVACLLEYEDQWFFFIISRKCTVIAVSGENNDQMNRKQIKAAPEEAAIRIQAKTNSSSMISSAR